MLQGISDVVEVLDTELDPVRIVAASPNPRILEVGGLGGRKLIVASEYEALTRKCMDAKGIPVCSAVLSLPLWGGKFHNSPSHWP